MSTKIESWQLKDSFLPASYRVDSVIYNATGQTATITLPVLIGATIVQITRGTQPINPATNLLNNTTGTLTFETPLEIYETVYIIYATQ